MYITNKKYRLAELDKNRLKESAQLLAEVYLNENKVWAAISLTPEDIYQFMLNKTSQMLDWQQELRQQGIIDKDAFINFVYLDENNSVVGVWTNFQLTQYLSKSSKVQLPQFDVLEKYGKQLQKSIDARDIVPGLSIYGMFLGLKKEVMKTDVLLYFSFDAAHYLHSQGFRVNYGRSSNPKTVSVTIRYGEGQMLRKIKAIENGKQITLSFVRWPITPLPYNRHYLKNMNLKAKL